MDEYRKHLLEICRKCGKTFGSHYGGFEHWPHNNCPGPKDVRDWENAPKTIFEHTGTYKEKEV